MRIESNCILKATSMKHEANAGRIAVMVLVI
jgi:hypothetical protein